MSLVHERAISNDGRWSARYSRRLAAIFTVVVAAAILAMVMVARPDGGRIPLAVAYIVVVCAIPAALFAQAARTAAGTSLSAASLAAAIFWAAWIVRTSESSTAALAFLNIPVLGSALGGLGVAIRLAVDIRSERRRRAAAVRTPWSRQP